MLQKHVYRHNNIAVFYFIIYRYGVAAALKTNGIDIHNNVTAVAYHLIAAFVITRSSADITGIKAYAVGTSIGFLYHDKTNFYIVVGNMSKAVKMSVRHLFKRNIHFVIPDLTFLGGCYLRLFFVICLYNA